MKNKQTHLRYAPLAAQFERIDGPLPLYRFAAVEAVLHLLSLYAPKADPTKAYLLFAQYHQIGTTACTAEAHILQRARQKLGYYRSQKTWQDDLNAYRDPRYAALRAFSFETTDGNSSFSKEEGPHPYPYAERQREWEGLWSEAEERLHTPLYAGAGTYTYFYSHPEKEEGETVHVHFEKAPASPGLPDTPPKGCRAPISVSLDELLQAAVEMEKLCPGDPCCRILRTNILRQVDGSSVNTCKALTIREVVHIVGMVGAGKSTLIKVLAFWCHKNGYRISIVVDTVAEVLNLQRYLSSFGVTASPLIGRSERLKYIHQVAQPEETVLHTGFSPYLTPLCAIDGLDDRHSAAIAFGKEPCYTLKKGNRHHLCPYFDSCSGTKMLRECYTASVVITTVAGFASTRVGHGRETFSELVMRTFDLVIFDECDRVQKTLDHLFMPETSFNDYIHTCAEDCSAFMKLSSKEREGMPAMQRYDELQRQSVTVLSCLVRSLHHDLGAWNKITYGDPFSALTLLEDLHREESEYRIPDMVYTAIYRLIDVQDRDAHRQGTLWDVLESACKSIDDTFFRQMYHKWLEELGDNFPRPQAERERQIQDARIRLILQLIYFDHFIRNLSDAYEACHETAYGQNELFGFLQTRFRAQQDLLPSALCGNLFGLKKTDTEDLLLFRQFAFGRSLMKDLPYLRTDAQGRPTGPHVLLLSGSSWAEGACEYHVNRPVSYILEAEGEKRTFLERTRFFESGFPERISGASDDQRMVQLRKVTRKTVELIQSEYERRAGKILLVVNSYAQAEVVGKTLEEALREVQCPARVCRMISDGDKEGHIPGTIRRGEVARFAAMDAEMLIAPAMAIERGHNIVDESGHSALSAVFFMVRPMAVPDDLRQMGSKLNGLVEARCQRAPDESLFDFHRRIRQFSMQQWVRMTTGRAFGLAELDADQRKDIVATLFVLILQIFGRLARVTDVTRPEPHVYFIDGAFRRREDRPEDFDCLSELGRYLDGLMTGKDSAEIARTLYAPFYKAYRKDIQYES